MKKLAFVILLSTGVVFASQLRPVDSLIESARHQIGITTSYNPEYLKLDYPMGDVPKEEGVCTDVIIRAFRGGVSYDLQKEVHEDMQKNFSLYPNKWRMKTTDKNIDHRRVPNLMKFFERKGWSLEVKSITAKEYLPGDLVTCTVPPNLPHIMILSDRVNSSGIPYVIHNIGQGAKEEDRLEEFPLTGHYRISGFK